MIRMLRILEANLLMLFCWLTIVTRDLQFRNYGAPLVPA